MKQPIDPLHSFANLPDEIESKLRHSLQIQSFQAGETIFLQGNSAEWIYLVAHGRAKIVRVTEEGFESILCVRGPGDYFCPVPLLDNGSQLGTAIAMTDVTLFQVKREKFNALCEQSSELLAVVQGDCLSEVRSLLNRMETFAFRGVRERIAFALLNETEETSIQGKVQDTLRLTQQELAALVGASRESVSRNLSQLAAEGLVIVGRGKITIKNRDGLEAIVH